MQVQVLYVIIHLKTTLKMSLQCYTLATRYAEHSERKAHLGADRLLRPKGGGGFGGGVQF